MNFLRNERGLTLIEILIVLFVMMCVTGIVTKISLKVAETKELDRFFEQLQLDIQFIQTYSMQQQQYVSMKFESPPHRYVIKKDHHSLLYERYFPKGVKFINSSSTVKTLIYNFDGRVTTAGTLYFQTPKGIKKVVITLGFGRSRVE